MATITDPVLQRLYLKILEQKEHIIESLASGSCKMIEDYKHLTGQIHGLKWVEQELSDLSERIEKE